MQISMLGVHAGALRLDSTGAPDTPKGVRPVRRGADGKRTGDSTSPAAYSTS
jgi:hypothetical protein